ncbi:hypothetical protein RFI_30031, partial [Reticulomyxa filosa]
TIVKVELFDKGKSRPKSHFKQCRKCYRLNHIVQRSAKYVSIADWRAKNYHYIDAAKEQRLNGNENKNGLRKPKKKTNRKKNKRKINNDQEIYIPDTLQVNLEQVDIKKKYVATFIIIFNLLKSFFGRKLKLDKSRYSSIYQVLKLILKMVFEESYFIETLEESLEN